jgi:hypothetical protein
LGFWGYVPDRSQVLKLQKTQETMANLADYQTQDLISELTRRRSTTFGRLLGLIEQIDSPASVVAINAEIRDNAQILDEPSTQFLLHELSFIDRKMPHEAYMAAITEEFDPHSFASPLEDLMRQWVIDDQRVQAYKADAAQQFELHGLNYWQVRKFYCWLKSKQGEQIVPKC